VQDSPPLPAVPWFFHGTGIKLRFYHREATRTCSCMTHPSTESVGGAPPGDWGYSSSPVSSAEIPARVQTNQTD